MTRTVLHVLEAFAGGTERHLLDLIKYVPDVEHVIAVPSTHLGKPTLDAVAQARELGASVEIIEMARVPTPHRNASSVKALRTVLRRWRPSVLHGHSSIGGAISRLAATGIPIPLVYTPNALSRSPLALAVERSLRWRTDRFIAVSESEAEFALRNHVATPNRLTVIPNGIDLDPDEQPTPSLRALLGIPTGAPVVGCLGRLTWQKAPEVFVSACGVAASELPETHFVLVGQGPHRDRVRTALAQTRLNGRFHWLGALPRAAGTLGELDLYVLPSRYEGGPYTPLEAMRAKTPVILTDVAGNRDTVEHGVTGLLVPVEDHHALGHAITDLMTDAERRAAIAGAARRRLDANFDVRKMGETTGRLYDELIGIWRLLARSRVGRKQAMSGGQVPDGQMPGGTRLRSGFPTGGTTARAPARPEARRRSAP